jgi:hypothetical protein
MIGHCGWRMSNHLLPARLLFAETARVALVEPSGGW